MDTQRLPLLLLAAALMPGGGLRLAGLERAPLRNDEFHSMQLLTGWAALYAGWRALGAGRPVQRDIKGLVRAWLWTMGTAAAFIMATRVQDVSLTVVLAWCSTVAITAVADARLWGRAALRWSMPLHFTLAPMDAHTGQRGCVQAVAHA